MIACFRHLRSRGMKVSSSLRRRDLALELWRSRALRLLCRLSTAALQIRARYHLFISDLS